MENTGKNYPENVHEMTHLREPGHSQRFRELMNQYISNWEVIRDELNRLPIRHIERAY